MKTSILSTLVIASLLLFVAGCDKESLLVHQPEKNPGTPAVGSRTLTLSAEMPSDGPTTRIALTQVGKRIDMAWEAGDVLQLCFVQGATKIKSWVEVSNISADGKKASFNITIPDEIVAGTFDLYGVYGGLGLSEIDPRVALLPGIGGPGSLTDLSDREDAMLIFSSLGIQTSNPQVSVTFRHLGALFCIKLKNNNEVAMNDLGSLRLTSTTGGWAYNFSGGGEYDLVNDVFRGTGSAGDYLSFISPVNTLASGDSLSIWGWFPPLSTAIWPELSLEIRDGWNAVRVTSENGKPARGSALSAGKSYYFYAMWDGEFLMLTDSTFLPPPELKDLTLTGNLRHADSGTDFLGMTYLRSDSIYYNEAKEPGVWTGEVLMGRGSDPRMAIDGNDDPHVVYTTPDGKIAYRTRSGGTWSSPVYIESNNGGVCSKPDIALDASGYAHVTYTDTKGYLGGYYIDADDVMYAVNTSGSFVKSVVWYGYYDSYGDGSNGFGMYFTKGSRIELNGEGQPFVITHNKTFLVRSGVSTDSYYVAVESGIANGSVGGTLGTDSEDIYDLAFDGTNVIAFYKAGGVNQTAALTISEATVSFADTMHVATPISNTYLNPGTLVGAAGIRGLGGTTSAEGKFFAKLGTDEMIIDEFVVKEGTVPVVLVMAGTAYAVFTDTSGTTRIGKNE